MRIVFMGTPEFAVPSLAALVNAGHQVAAVFCQPDRPAGRGHALRSPPAKQFALDHAIAVEQPTKLRDPGAVEQLAAYRPEIIVVVAYGKILPRTFLEFPQFGAINVHGSLLPHWRGAAPIQRAILAGDKLTGVTIMQLNEGMDQGDILNQCELTIRPDDTSATLAERMAEVGANALVNTLDLLLRGEIVPEPQNDDEATLAPMIRKEEGEIDWTAPAARIERAIRAFTPWPSAFTHLDGRRIKLLQGTVCEHHQGGDSGKVLRADGDIIEVATGSGTLRILRLQPEGKRSLTAREAVTGRLLRTGDCLG